MKSQSIRLLMIVKIFLAVAIVTITAMQSRAQSSGKDKNVPGRFFKAPSCKIPGFKIDALFEIINRLPAITQPKGYDVQERFTISTEGKVYKARLSIPLLNPPPLHIFINDPQQLMNPQSILFPEETRSLQLPEIFSDTFAITYKKINGVNVGTGIHAEFNSNLLLHVLNPRHSRFFKPVTKEQYLRFWIGKLTLDINRDSKQLEESKSNLKLMADNAALKSTIPEIEKSITAFIKWISYLKAKKQQFQKRLDGLSTDEKKAPAYYAMYTDAPAMIDQNGKYVENISGHLPYEPAEDNDTLNRTPLYNFAKDPFDPKLPKTAFQLIIIKDPFSEGKKNRIKELIDKEFYPLLNFKDIAQLMYK